MVVGVVADTHLPRFGTRLPRALLEGLAAADPALILHAGDHTTMLAVEQLSELAPVEAVAGNNDGPELVERFGPVRRIVIGEIRLGLTHGHLGRGRTSPERAASLFLDDPVDVVVFGHSHQPLWRPRRGDAPALLNPGSPTDRRREPAWSFALLEIGGDVGARIVRFRDRSA